MNFITSTDFRLNIAYVAFGHLVSVISIIEHALLLKCRGTFLFFCLKYRTKNLKRQEAFNNSS